MFASKCHMSFVSILILVVVLNEVKHVDAEWGGWNGFSNCNALNITGRMVQRRTRSCVTVCPSSGLSYEYRYNCPAVSLFVHLVELSTATTTLEHGQFVTVNTEYHLQSGGGHSVTTAFAVWSSTDPDGRFHGSADEITPYYSWTTLTAGPTQTFTLKGDATEALFSGPYSSTIGYTRINYLSTIGKYRITNNPNVNKLHLSSHIRMSTSDSEIILSRQVIYNVQPSTVTPSLALVFPMKTSRNEFPGSAAHQNIEIETEKSRQINNVFVRFLAPPTIDASCTNHLVSILYPENTLNSTWLQRYCIAESNQVVFQFPYLMKKVLAYGFFLKNAMNDWTKYTQHSQKPKFIVDVNYCLEGGCFNSEQFNFQTFSYKKTPELDSQHQLGIPLTKPFRIKETTSGLCWSLKEGDAYIRVTSQCKDLFVYNPDSSLVHYKTGKIIRIKDDYLETDGGDIRTFIYNRAMKMIIDSRESTCLETTADNRLLKVDPPNYTKDLICAKGQQILPGSPEMVDKIAMKSLLVTTTSLGNTIVACSPHGDLASKYNCFFSTNTGASWTGLQSVLSSLQFFLPNEDTMYGLCHRAKSYCKWHIPTNRIISLPKSDFTAAQLGNTMVFSILDDFDLSTEPFVYPNDETLAVSSLGLYKTGSSGWERIYLWGN